MMFAPLSFVYVQKDTPEKHTKILKKASFLHIYSLSFLFGNGIMGEIH